MHYEPKRDDLAQLLKPYKLGEGGTIVPASARRKLPLDRDTLFSQYRQLDRDAGDLTPNALWAAAVDYLKAVEDERAAAVSNAGYPSTASEMAQLIAEREQIETDHRGKWWMRGYHTSRTAVSEAIKIGVMNINRRLPRDANGRALVQPFTPEHVVGEFFHLNDVLKGFEAIHNLRESMAHDPTLDPRALAADFLKLLTVEFTPLKVAVLCHCIQNAKRLMYDVPPKYEMIFNVLGGQGIGKTYTLKLMLSAGQLKPFFTEMAFAEIADPNFFTLGSNYFTILVNEPSGSKEISLNPQELEAFKSVMSKTEFNSRVYHTQTRQVTPRTFSLWGSSNKHFYEIVRDPSGQRRLFEVEMTAKTQIDGANDFDYLALWKSIDHAGAAFVDPRETPEIWNELVAEQAKYLPPDTLLMFLNDGPVQLLNDDDADVATAQDLTTQDLFHEYKRWCERFNLRPKAWSNFQSDLLKQPLRVKLIDRKKHYMGVYR